MVLQRVDMALEYPGYDAQSLVDITIAKDDPRPGDGEQMLHGVLVVPGTNCVKWRSIQQTSQHHRHEVSGIGSSDAHHIVLFQSQSLQLLGNADGKGYGLAIGQSCALGI